VAVIEARTPDTVERAILTNGKPDGSTGTDYPTMALAALVPALFAASPERAFVIGYGTGVTVGELAALDSIRSVRVAEISPGVIEAAPLFEDKNQGALASGKTEVIVSDAYRALLRSGERYDVIASEPSNPWVTGVEMLFSQEFLQAARDHLQPGGVYAQWFHLYENSTPVIELVLRTYASVFDHVAVWYALGPDLLLLGFVDPDEGVDLGHLQARAAQPDFAAGLRRAGIDHLPQLLGHELLPLDVVNAAGFQGDVQTLLHPVLSYRAGRAFFLGQMAALPPTAGPAAAAAGARNSLLGRFVAASGGALPDAVHEQLVNHVCAQNPVLCATLTAKWMRDVPESGAREAMLVPLRQNPVWAKHLGAPKLATLAALFGPSGAVPGAASPEEAQRLTDLFVTYYHHGTPFSRAVLAAVWQRCAEHEPRGRRCQSGLRAAEARVGPLRSTAAARRPDASG
jgi:spermidine synthase